nr:hypothetical protein [Tanacetum cinerariifolium]
MGKGLFNPNGKRGGKVEVGFDNFRGGEEIRNCGGNGGRGSSIFRRGGGSLAICSMESKDGLEGGRLLFLVEGVTKSLLGETPGRVAVKNLELMEGPFDSRWVVRGDYKERISDVGLKSN